MWRMLVVFVVEQQGQAANTANINFESYDVLRRAASAASSLHECLSGEGIGCRLSDRA
jgi:hypothetical protein